MKFAQHPSSSTASSIWLPLCLMLAALLLRVLSHNGILPPTLGNFSPLVAFAFAGAIVFPRNLPWWSWAILLLAIDWIVFGSVMWQHANGRFEVLALYVCYALAAWAGSRLRGKVGIIDTLLGTLACSGLFYLVTNTLSWWVDPGYIQKSGATWVQALTTGLPGYPSTLSFFRNSLIADMTGALVLVSVYNAEAIVRNLQRLPLLGLGRHRAA
ncbi:DUF6580 family putative transport protein [Phragmitibacter flavus]